MSALPVPSPDSADVLSVLVARRGDVEQAERDVLRLAVAYAAQHPAAGISEAESAYVDRPAELAGPGAPGVAEFAVAELSAALGMTPAAGRRFLGAALEVAHRLPQVWARVQADQVTAWKARMVAERTVHLSQTGAAYVDAAVAARLDRVGPVTLGRLVEEARLLAEEPEADSTLDHQASRQVQIDTRSAAVHGIAYVDAAMDAADALDLEKAIQTAAARLKADGNDLPLDLRRALALGVIARHYLAGHGESEASGGVQLYLHYTPDSPLGRADYAHLDDTKGLATLGQIGEWLSRTGASVKVTPIIDLAATITSSGYVPGPKLRDQVTLRTRPAPSPAAPARPAPGISTTSSPTTQAAHQARPPARIWRRFAEVTTA